jgi:hypothetical protein
MRLLTVYISCCTELELHDKIDKIDRIFRYRDNKRTVRELVLRVLYKEVKEVVSNKVIIIEGWFLNANTIKTIGVNGEWRKWYL